MYPTNCLKLVLTIYIIVYNHLNSYNSISRSSMNRASRAPHFICTAQIWLLHLQPTLA
ncbi:hypothetical protein CANARDRAFT_28127 [[Candida] arabinofermentans NRRL YB-2248]|uniref:Uncharacterized protein n=1 Tax=[Candida] arabinofermentans NRRL YB-2248 TaxID=983967 RepID=A0A1E4T2V2_9ASCO|nr:hypothetical protein CANARDRAFT_28127 [[Candida] arabinofermentans NRRL YB-2248]